HIGPTWVGLFGSVRTFDDGARAVADEFGPEFLDETGGVDRARLAAHVFSDPGRVARLNARIHPLVHEAQRRWFDDIERSGRALGVVEATLLLESGGRERYDVVVTVSAPEEMRLARAMRRSPGSHEAELRRRIENQLTDAAREKVADFVIVNDGTEEELIQKADTLADGLRKRTKASPASS
ncbi:MAG TPA: dephospho-CoA kinase, partial [Thermoanaerobaculia bacterium]|nr:dephospho-CoA kinase [Thermoanaerobaculia bacterium]